MKILVRDEDFGSIVICAVRYALGRRTYMPQVVTEWITGNCKKALSKKTLDALIRDIEEFGKHGPESYGDTWDFEMWMGFLDWCRRERLALDE